MSWSAPLEIVSVLPVAPMFTIWLPPAVSKVSEFTERTVMPLLHASGLTMPAVVKSVAALLLLSSSITAETAGSKRTMLLDASSRAIPVAVPSFTTA